MILGRPTNLILGAFTAIFNVVILALNGQGHPIDASIVAGINIAAAALIGLIAFQPPTLNPGDTINVTTPAPAPNQVQVVSAMAPAPTPASTKVA